MSGKRSDQARIIEDQQQQLQRYEKRLRDVITAYKSLLKEKQALEESLKALNETGLQDGCAVDTPRRCEDQVAGSSQGRTSTPEELRPQERIATLMNALATLTNEKSRTEANLKAEKKALKKERDDLSEQLHLARQDWSKASNEFKEQINELRNKLWVQQMDREKEQNNHAVMLRELQTLVAIERSSKEQLESQLDELLKSVTRKSPVQQKCEEYQSKVQKLSDELQVVRDRLKAAEEKALQPQPLLLKLQQQMMDMKAQHGLSISQERHRANDAEERLQHIAKASEERVASLEAKLSELSEVVGSYDRVRHQDQQAILRLKERVSQLDLENVALARAASSKNVEEDSPDDEYTNLDVQALVGKMVKMKRLLHLANERSEKPVNVEDFLQKHGLSAEVDHCTCRKELHQLKEEFEHYKLRTQSMLKNRNVKGDGDDCHSKEIAGWKAQVIELNNKVRMLMKDLEERDCSNRRFLQGAEATLAHAKLQSGRELAKLEAEYRGRVSELENQMQKQRERTLLLLAEKDDDVKLLKMTLGIFGPDVKSERCKAGAKDGTGAEEEEEQTDVGERLPLSEALSTVVRNEGHLLHYVQEIARKDQEIASLRKAKHLLETELRELRMSTTSQEEKHMGEIERLEGEIHRLDRNRSREGANLEYLKNVVYNYMTSSDVNHRQHMLNAIATLLEFSPQELQAVKHYNSTWWWQQTPKRPEVGFGS